MLIRHDIEAIDETYCNLRDNPKLESLRVSLEAMWKRFESYADPEFEIEISIQFQQRFWEMFLTCTLMDYDISPIHKAKKGPDIKVNMDSKIVWIEAIALEPGSGPDAMMGSEEYGLVPESKIVLRFQAGIHEKYNKAKKYLSDATISSEDPFIIAINGHNVPYANEDDAMPYAIQAVLPLGLPTWEFDNRTGEIVSKQFAYRPSIKKKSGAKIPTTTFLDSEYSVISGILYSNTNILDLLEPRNDFVFLHNPNSANPLPKGWLKVGHEYWVENEKLKFKTWV